VVNDYATSNGLLKDLDENLKGEDIREGLTAVISIKHPDPQFEGQTKTKLGNSEVRGIVESAMHEGLGTFFEENPDTAEAIVAKAVEAAKARKAAQKAEELTRRRAPSTRRPSRVNWPIARRGIRARRSCSSSRATRPAAAPNRAGTGSSRPSSP
jgi:DNA gyrase subunit B